MPQQITTANDGTWDPSDESWVDEALAPMNVFLSALLTVPEPSIDESTGVNLYVESLKISIPCEIDVLNDGSSVRLAGGPPTQYTETTIMPIFHHLKLTIEADQLSING